MVKKYGPLYVKDTIPAKSYPGQDTVNHIATVWNVLVADGKLSDQVAYDIVKTMFERREDMMRVHKDARYFDLQYQTNGAAVIRSTRAPKSTLPEKGLKLN